MLPLRYAVDGLREIMLKGQGLGDVGLELGVAAFAIVLMSLAAITVRRT